MRIFLFFSLLLLFASGCQPTPKETSPNILVIYMDDLGFGDVGFNGGKAISTPNMDRLANEGLNFVNAYSSSATCTPSRYALLTGVYPWREKRARILPGTAPLIIDTAQATLPRMLQSKGYYTAIIGKWHLGLGDGDVNWNETISPGPNELGFDYSYILAATQDRVPTVYIEDGNVVGLEEDDPIEVDYKTNFEGVPTALTHPELLEVMWDHGHNNSIVNGIPRIGFMKGGKNALWSDIDMADAFLNQAKTFMTSHSKEPFFLFYPMQQPHVPRTPHPRFVGATDLGPRGDVIAEADWVIGELLAQLETEGILENTLVIFTSDNGPVLNDGYVDQAVERNGDHKPWGPLRGGKYSLFEAGTHVPFVAYWKGKIQTGTSNSLISQLDLFSSLAAIVNSEERTADSHDLHQTLLGQSQLGRKDLIIEASGRTALRTEDWVYIPPYTGRRAVSRFTNIELGNSETPLLYHLKTDIGQQQNLATDSLSQLESMQKQYKTILGVE